jgi:hypothetical protein
MYQDSLAVSTAGTNRVAFVAPLRSPEDSGVDPHAIVRARLEFEGLILQRGRHGLQASNVASIRNDRRASETHADVDASLNLGVAQSGDEIDAIRRLVRTRYAWRGYALDAFDYQNGARGTEASRREIAFFVTEPEATLGTITLRLDGPDGLHAETTHGEAVSGRRTDARRVAELTRLAVAEGAKSRSVLASLFGLVYAVGRAEHGVTDVFIEVNPRHVAFYVRTLGFTVAGDARMCERVGAPSVLLHLEVVRLEQQFGTNLPAPVEERARRYGT